ncbi:S66 peptidase family protein [Paenibacillus gansuensis]|uniref:LD-carboxypeptidase n=1 Tax=Paenibacillus gansuensis TaxID=306542 RepID=A0ABW5PDY1_9BACL
MRQRIKPRRLKKGDTIGITAPAGWGSTEKMLAAAAWLEGLGYRVKLGKTLTKRYGYLAGTDKERAEELNSMFADPFIQAILCARGGYGTARIAELLDYESIRRNPKLFWGYSDITFLHAAIAKYAGLVTFHGPMLLDLAKEDVHPLTLANFETWSVPMTFKYTEHVAPLTALAEGEAEGILTGGNLSLLVSTLGTAFELDTAGKLLLIEDIGEEPYRLDRMLNQLRLAGKFADASGIILGDFHDCDPPKEKDRESLSLAEVLADHVVSAGKPVLAGFRIGHCSPNIAVPLGVHARLNTYEKLLECSEPAIW